MSLHIVVLAAGQGKRMYSNLPKVLHPVGGKPMLQRTFEAAFALEPAQVHVIIGHQGDKIRETLTLQNINWVNQSEQLGTGHAVMQALPFIPDNCNVLVLSADVPLIKTLTLQALVEQCEPTLCPTPLSLLTATVPNPYGLGRIVRNRNNEIIHIIEERDATEDIRQINEIYSGICCTSAQNLKRWLPKLSNQNAQAEYYLTEIISMAVEESTPVRSFEVGDYLEIQGANNRVELHTLERAWQKRISVDLMLNGVSFADASRVDIRGELSCGKDIFIDVNTIFEGQVNLSDGCSIGPNCVLKNVSLGENCVIHANSVLEGAQLGREVHIGPFARLRPGTQLGDHCKIGNFVETKAAIFDVNSKANHLSYLGDVTVGKDVNIGAGTITCNYDGAKKHQTVIEDGAFIGSDTQLVAPVTVGAYATLGAGTTLRKDAPAHELTLTACQQKTIPGWKRPKK